MPGACVLPFLGRGKMSLASASNSLSVAMPQHSRSCEKPDTSCGCTFSRKVQAFTQWHALLARRCCDHS